MDAHQRIGDYEILEELGRGGMGRVYRVRNVISDRIEAMKVLLPDLVGRQDLAARFVREIKVLAALDHPNIAELRTALTADNQLVMIMEFVDGESLAHRLRHGPLAPAVAVAYLDQVLSALAYAHRQHVIHRDIKPANMMVTPQGVVKLTDFGIARSRNDQTLTAAGTTTGSLAYMSPEQVNGEPTDARSDLYSVGVSLYEMVTGQKPFRGDSDFAVMVAHLNEQPRPPIELDPALGAELNAVILKSMAKVPNDRYQSADEFRDALRGLGQAAATAAGAAAAETVVAAPRGGAETATRAPAGAVPPVPEAPQSPPVIPPVPAPVTKSGHPAVYVALGAVLVIGVLVAAGLYIGRADAEPGPADASTEAPADDRSTPSPAVAAAPAAPADASAAGPATSAADSPTAESTSTAPPSQASPASPPPAAAEPSAVAPVAAPAPADSPATASTTARTATRSTGGEGRTVGSGPRPARPDASPRPAPEPPAATAQPAAPAVDFDELEQAIDQLIVRAETVTRSLDTMQQQQARQGLGLRGDIAARQQSMNLNLARAQQAVTARDGARAERFKALAEADIEALERFLGR